MSFAKLCFYKFTEVNRVNNDALLTFSKSSMTELASGGNPNTKLPQISFNNVKIRRTYDTQYVDLPVVSTDLKYIADSNLVVAKFNDDSSMRWYWVTGWEEITHRTENAVITMNIRVTLEYEPVTSLLVARADPDSSDPDVAVSIVAERMPYETPNVRQTWTQSVMQQTIPSSATPGDWTLFPLRGSSSDKHNVLWAEVCYTGWLNNDPQQGSDNKIRRIGFFVTAEGGTHMTSIQPSDGSVGETYTWLTIDELIQDPLGCADVAGTVVDIVVSEFCPFIEINSGSTFQLYASFDTFLHKGGRWPSAADTYYAYYNVDDIYLNIVTYSAGINKHTGTINLTDFEVHNGQVVLRDHNKNIIMEIPVEKNETAMEFNVETYSDCSGIYHRVRFGDTVTVIQGTHLPWGTSAWEEYRTYNLEYDRQALQNNIDSAYRSMNVTVLNGLSNAVIGGGIAGGMKGGPGAAGLGVATGVASASGSILGGALQTKYAIKDARLQQDLTEYRMRGAPVTANNTASGTNYAILVNRFGGAEIGLLMPASFTETDWQDQIVRWGYPGNKSVTSVQYLIQGYWKGILEYIYLPVDQYNNGVALELLAERFANGVRIIDQN